MKLDEEKQEMILMSSYYYIGHFSRYIKRGANNLGIVIDKEAVQKGLESCAFRNPDGEIVIVMMNVSEESMEGCVQAGEETFDVKLDSHSIGTILL